MRTLKVRLQPRDGDYRAFYYDAVEGKRHNTVAFLSVNDADSELADAIECGATGGDIERYVEGVGWCLLADEEDGDDFDIAEHDAPPCKSRAARDARSGRIGGESYWRYLEEAECELHDKLLAAGDKAGAEAILNRSLSDALRGNDGD